MKLGKRKCKKCKKEFQKVSPLQFLCSYECLKSYQKENEKKEQKEWKKRKKVLIEKTTTISQWKKKLEKEINQMVRSIDHGNTCMMCDNRMRSMYACHYHAVGSNDSLRFNLFNIWGGCYSCNGFKGGNIQGYDMQLIQKVGGEKWEYIKFELVKDYPLIKLGVEEIKELIVKVRELNKEIDPVRRSTMERWQLRKIMNNKIGIY